MRFHGCYLGQDLEQFEVLAEIDKDNVNRIKVAGSYINQGPIKSFVKTVDEFVMEDAVLDDFLPRHIATMFLTRTRDVINLKKIRELEIDYPEQKYKINSQGQLQEIVTEKDNEIKAELGGL